MALIFICRNCGKDIIADSKKGETAKCIHCGAANIVPADALETNKTLDYARKTDPILIAQPSVPGSTSPLILAPRKLDEILSEAWRIYKKQYVKLWTIAAVSGVLYGALYALYFVFIFSMPHFIESIQKIYAYLPYVVAGFSIFIAISMIASTWVQCALIYAISCLSLNKEVSFGQAYGFAWRRLGAAILANILCGSVVGVLALTIIGIPFAVFLAVSWSFVLQTVLLEGYSPAKALARSFSLVKKTWWRVMGINLMFSVIAAGVGSLLGIIPFLGAVISVIISTPIGVLGSVLLYFDLRVRKEGYTIEKLAEEIGVANKS